ncbi:hypothetical protein DRO69_02325 [Candidatus Bathyarchaeota archaeon]|nr:MAG: hypothetical protein DRO69_02325 [Candidatus Bathyarchaeota archaeon]
MVDEESVEHENYSLIRFVVVVTLTVVGMALCIMSGWIFFIGMLNLGIRGPPFSYMAIIAFWSFIVILIVLAAVIDWMKKKKASQTV